MHRIGYDGNPTYSSEPNTQATTGTSTSSCTTATVTDCSVTISYGINGVGSTTTSSTTTSCSTAIGCSVSAFTTTASTASTCTVSSFCQTATICPSLFGRQVNPSACTTAPPACETVGCGNVDSYDVGYALYI
jgi:hypothetical protein